MYEGALALSCIDAISKELDSLGLKFRTIYIGGGTPTVLGRESLKRLLTALKKCIGSSCEVTIEANPESMEEEKLGIFLDNGINRISIGAQSFSDRKLKELGRLHDAGLAKKVVEMALKKGFENINIDLIFATPGEDLETWKKDLTEAVSLPVKHISCYSLTRESEPEEEAAADMYEYAISYLPDKGFGQYEISNYAKSGYACRHNLNYWNNDPYIGVGPGAVSYLDGSRYENVSDISEYIRRAAEGVRCADSSEKLIPEDRARETAAIKIRTIKGIGFDWFKRKTGYEFMALEKDAVKKLAEDGLLECCDKGVHLMHKGILHCDTVSAAFL